MSSRQINFFAAPGEVSIFYDFFLEKHYTISKRSQIDEKTPIQYDLKNNIDNIIQVCVCRSGDLNQIYYKETDNSNRYFIDIVRSNCIEYSLGGFYPYSETELHISRFYCSFDYYDEHNRLVTKGSDFNKWAIDFLKEFKSRFLVVDKNLSSYPVTASFAKWINKYVHQESADGSKFIIKSY